MKKNKLKLIMAAVSIAILFSITGCSKSASSNTKTEKLALTKENVQKVFADEYDVGVDAIFDEHKSVSIVLNSKKDIPKDKKNETLKEVETTLHKNFDISNDNKIDISRNGLTIIKKYSGKIQKGQAPLIEIPLPTLLELPQYSMSTKFNLLNPVEHVQVSAKDDEDGDITSKIKLKNPNVLTKTGNQTLIYEVTDSDGNTETNNDLKIEITK
ncbi:DUF5011 domain-containing protein [Clostridium estertheticum]|uniref:DUF5011 domain-containing protein n=1 Tax=Clostridium estertheticum TaxID=238834 RepID=UPI001CF5D7F5|nr:DUF5011 domain-containing protein [Clostridium estertheticum]MCB2309254.1 DUF5011 domain-containing protein [Clostridium estertheticum]MCB2346897.1 DUF5011 domain-containing protein [Clostridium estertheticum]MCB2352235.1 DUF5011 domain-containing protein [Clostridium estertheticum]WAG48560.1 DUF5011 domain-containing protein [Clostridium estertheticum]